MWIFFDSKIHESILQILDLTKVSVVKVLQDSNLNTFPEIRVIWPIPFLLDLPPLTAKLKRILFSNISGKGDKLLELRIVLRLKFSLVSPRFQIFISVEE